MDGKWRRAVFLHCPFKMTELIALFKFLPLFPLAALRSLFGLPACGWKKSHLSPPGPPVSFSLWPSCAISISTFTGMRSSLKSGNAPRQWWTQIRIVPVSSKGCPNLCTLGWSMNLIRGPAYIPSRNITCGTVASLHVVKLGGCIKATNREPLVRVAVGTPAIIIPKRNSAKIWLIGPTVALQHQLPFLAY